MESALAERYPAPELSTAANCRRDVALAEINQRNLNYFEAEVQKLDAWADDLKLGLEQELKELDRQIKEVRREASSALTLEEKINCQKRQRELEQNRNRKRREMFDRQDQIDEERGRLFYQRAVERIAAVAEKAGERGLAAVIRSRILVGQDKPREAMQVLLAARQAGDQSAALLRQLSLMYEREGNLEAAKGQVAQQIASSSGNLAQVKLAADSTLIQNQNEAEAILIEARAVTYFPHSAGGKTKRSLEDYVWLREKQIYHAKKQRS